MARAGVHSTLEAHRLIANAGHVNGIARALNNRFLAAHFGWPTKHHVTLWDLASGEMRWRLRQAKGVRYSGSRWSLHKDWSPQPLVTVRSTS